MPDINIVEFISKLVLFAVVMLLAFSAHEAAHAWMAHKFGDDTAKDLGRMTLNPIPHIDLYGTIILPLATFILGGLVGFPMLFGYPKATPMNPRNWQNYHKANFWISSAGIMANIALVIIGFIAARIMMSFYGMRVEDLFDGIQNPFALFLGYLMSLNLTLFVLNLIPLPPLDGAEIFKSIMPNAFGDFMDSIAPYSFFIFIGLVLLGVLKYIMMPFIIALLILLQI